MPEYNRRSDITGLTNEAEIKNKIAEANRWYDEQEEKVMARVAKEFRLSVQEAEKIYYGFSVGEALQRKSFAESRGKILSGGEIKELLEEQGRLPSD
jgi:hypothetical protein